MKKMIVIALLSLNVFATDYTSMSITDMQAMRGNVPEADRAAFQTEMQSKMQALTPEERKAASATMRQNKSGSMNKTGSQMGKNNPKGMGGGTGGKMFRGGN